MQNLVFKGLYGEFKIVAATQYITRIKDSTNKIGKLKRGRCHWYINVTVILVEYCDDTLKTNILLSTHVTAGEVLLQTNTKSD